VSIEQVAALSSQNTLPEPTLDLSNLQPSSSILPSAAAPRKSSPLVINAPVPSYSSDDPWNTNPRFTNVPGPAAFGDIVAPPLNGSTSTLGTGLPTEWWKKQENIKVVLLGQQGFILNRYTVYEVTSDVRACDLNSSVDYTIIVQRRGVSVTRRYSEFVSLWDVLLRRYPFRLFPAIPPKRIGGEFLKCH
jgi:sorting nexin-8